MRRLLRILASVLTALSLAVFIFFASLWVRSYWRRDSFVVRLDPVPTTPYEPITRRAFELSNFIQHQRLLLHSSSGLVCVIVEYPYASGWLITPRDYQRSLVSYDGSESPVPVPLLRQLARGKTRGIYRVLVPHWLIVSIASLLPACWLSIWWRRRRAIAEGHCLTCGYDMRATPDRCPECGAVPLAVSSDASS